MVKHGRVNFTLIIILTAIALSFFAGKYYDDLYQQRLIDQQVYSEVEARRFSTRSLRIQKNLNAEYIRCMATNIYHEAGSEPFMGQVMVARVVMNRIQHGFARNPCAVIYAEHNVPHPDDPNETRRVCQFSWVCEGKDTPQRNETYKQAEDIARRVLTENAWNDIVPNDVLFFHNTSVNPRWAYERVATVGNHIFYSKKREK